MATFRSASHPLRPQVVFFATGARVHAYPRSRLVYLHSSNPFFFNYQKQVAHRAQRQLPPLLRVHLATDNRIVVVPYHLSTLGSPDLPDLDLATTAYYTDPVLS